jgi:hypothetical protein
MELVLHQSSDEWFSLCWTHLCGSEPFLRSLQLCSYWGLFSTFYGTRRFTAVFTRALHSSLSSARWIQSIPFQLFSLVSILMLSSHLHLPSDHFPSGFPTKVLYAFLFTPLRVTWPAHLILLDLIILIIQGHFLSYWVHSSALHHYRGIAGRLAYGKFADDIACLTADNV